MSGLLQPALWPKLNVVAPKMWQQKGGYRRTGWEGSSWNPPWLSLQLSAAPPSSGMYDSAQVGLLASSSRNGPGVGLTSLLGQIVPEVGSVRGEGLRWWGSVEGSEEEMEAFARQAQWRLSVPGRSCSTFAGNTAGCRTWTWAPGGSRPLCSHLCTLPEGRHTEKLNVHCDFIVHV